MLQLQLLVILCGIATIAIGSLASGTTTQRSVMAATFVACTAIAFSGMTVTPTAAASLVAAVSVFLLFRPSAETTLAPLASGAIAAHWVVTLVLLGTPVVAALAVPAAALMSVSMLAARRARFAPRIIQEEALLLVGVLSGLLAIGPGIIRGWQSAVALRATPLTDTLPAVAPWPFAVLGGALALGSLYAAWKHKRGN